MQILTERLASLHIKVVRGDSYKRAYHQLQREHETWFKYLILRYPERFQTAVSTTLILGVLCCMFGGIGYFFEFTQFGYWGVAMGLSSFVVFLDLMVLGVWSNSWQYNTPTTDASNWSKAEVEQYSRVPSTAQRIIRVIEANTDRAISYHFSFEGFSNPKTETATIMWSLWADDTSERRDWSQRVYFWVDRTSSNTKHSE